MGDYWPNFLDGILPYSPRPEVWTSYTTTASNTANATVDSIQATMKKLQAEMQPFASTPIIYVDRALKGDLPVAKARRKPRLPGPWFRFKKNMRRVAERVWRWAGYPTPLAW